MANCPGCGEEIAQGQHFMKVTVELDTEMGPKWEPVRQVEPTVLEVAVHSPPCFILWATNNGIMRDVFAR